MANEFWLSDGAWARIEPLLPGNQPGARRVDDRRVISGIVHVLKSGCRWQDCPAVYGRRQPSITVSTAGAGGGCDGGYLKNLSRGPRVPVT
jgi:transposase